MRCPFATDRCVDEVPPLRESGSEHRVACHYFAEIEAGAKAANRPEARERVTPRRCRASRLPAREFVTATRSS